MTPAPRFTTFRDGELTLSMLDKSTVRIPPSAPSDNDIVVVAGPRAWESRAFSLYGTKLLFFPHEDTLDRLAAGLLPEYMEGPFEELRFVLTDEGLGQLSGVCPQSLPSAHFQTCLNKASLAGDLLRFFLRLLARGVPAYLLTSGSSDMCRGAVTGLREVSSTQFGSQLIVHKRADDCSDLFHLRRAAAAHRTSMPQKREKRVWKDVCTYARVYVNIFISLLVCIHVCKYVRRNRAREHPNSGNSLLAPAPCGAISRVVATAPRSPAWHRRLRALRSKARTTLRAGRRLSARQYRLLADHHSTNPALRSAARLLMGRGETWAQDGDAWYSSAGSYQLWRGAKPGGKTGHVPWKPKGPKTPEKPRFPAYDAPSPPAKGGSKGSQGSKSHDAKEADEGMVSQEGRGSPEQAGQGQRSRKQSRSGRRMPLRREMRSTRSARDTPRPSRATIATSWRPRLCNPRPGELFGTRS